MVTFCETCQTNTTRNHQRELPNVAPKQSLTRNPNKVAQRTPKGSLKKNHQRSSTQNPNQSSTRNPKQCPTYHPKQNPQTKPTEKPKRSSSCCLLCCGCCCLCCGCCSLCCGCCQLCCGCCCLCCGCCSVVFNVFRWCWVFYPALYEQNIQTHAHIQTHTHTHDEHLCRSRVSSDTTPSTESKFLVLWWSTSQPQKVQQT